MKVVLICPSNMLVMPYVTNYVDILKSSKADYTIINWDRLCLENESEFTFRDGKKGLQRSFSDYCRYSKFITAHLNKIQYDKVVVFGLQLSFFLSALLQNRFAGNYILDVRDRNKIINFLNLKKIIKNSSFVVISSNGYKKWMPPSDKYIINHNTRISSIEEIKPANSIDINKPIHIGYIGAPRDYRINAKLIKALIDSKRIKLFFHGAGVINDRIETLIGANNVKNVFQTGKYEKDQEEKLYMNEDLINVLRYNDSINNSTALPNRIYTSAIYGKLLLAFKGTYLAEVVKEYGLGLVLESFKDAEDQIFNYIKEFNISNFDEGRKRFLLNVINENTTFKHCVTDFIGNAKQS